MRLLDEEENLIPGNRYLSFAILWKKLLKLAFIR
jgi:hypothetical protein